MKMYRRVAGPLFFYFSVLFYASLVMAEPLMIGEFSANNLHGWEEKTFEGKTTYSIVNQAGKDVLAAESRAAASGLFKKITVDLKKTPYINWSWKAENVLPGINEKTKKGDDYPARIYMVSSGGFFIWNTKAISYVWSSNQVPGDAWPNAYTSKAHMVVVESGDSNIAIWKSYKRNVREDFKRFFGKDVSEIDVVAVMTDTDNSGLSAKTYYGDIYFTSK